MIPEPTVLISLRDLSRCKETYLMTFSLLCAAAAIGAAPVQTPVTAQAAPFNAALAVPTLKIIEADGVYSIRADLPGVVIGTADDKAPALPIRVGNAVRLDASLFGIEKEASHASDH
ncbi:hypothetical protein [Novosphingobium sp. KA1]|uniref:hypothetical protein n=1 Tax=Novosphingobium sp. (strain KA1) TaxID=164608 RepID=UPI001A9064FD|nr:hypothetical protein [Novosphingobium sp. KA1]QSR19710.1 hypothetical protein CA833_21440 [Novosphingobium sp. KA1]